MTVEDGLRAFEAYHHYIAVKKYELAGDVIIKRRSSQWESGAPLGNSLYRFGLLESIKISVNGIISHIPSGYNLGRIYKF